MRAIILLILGPLAFLPHGAWPHGGGLDEQGGHTDRSTGFYHCHREPCFSNYSGSTGAVAEGAPFVLLYDRNSWPHWLDLDGDCQDTRDEVLLRDSRSAVSFREADRCNVESGQWRDPYSGKKLNHSSELDVDHVVPLKWAHGHGGDRWSREEKAAFSNDMENLLAVESGMNRAKGARGPDDWLPPRKAYRCEYLQKFVSVMRKYQLKFVPVERQALDSVLSRCGVAS